MKIAIKKIDLEYSANAVSKALTNKLEGKMGVITLCAENDALNVATGNGEIVISSNVQAEVIESGKVNVAGKLFCEAIKKISDEEIEMYLDKELYIRCADGFVKIPALDGSIDWTDYKQPTSTSEIKLAISEFKNIVKRSIAFCSTDDSRPLLKGVNIKTVGDVLTAVALDGYRLAKSETKITASNKDINVIVPASALNCICSILGNDGEIALQVSDKDKLLQVKTKDTTFTAVLLQGEFVSYDRIIPTSFTTQVKAPKKEMLSALERASMFGDMYSVADFEIAPDSVEIKSKGASGEAYSKVKATADGKDLEIAFNAKYFIGVLKLLAGDTVEMSFNKQNEPTIIKETGATFLLLPIRRN